MPLSFQQQLDLGISSISRGDIDLFSTMLVDPMSVTPDEQRSVAERLGIKKGLLSAFVDTIADPTVWVAYMMSRRFPTQAWLSGNVPKRFIGGATQFTGLSYVTRPVSSFFRGGLTPKLTALAERRSAEVMKVAEKVYHDVQSRPNWKDEMPVVSLIMEGAPVSGATPELHKVAEKLRGHMDELWGFLSQTRKVEGGFVGGEIQRASSRPFTSAESPKYLRDYLPHLPLTVDEGIVEVGGREALRRMSKGPIRQALQLKGENFADVWTADATNRLSSDFVRYQSMLGNVGAEVFSPHLFKRQRFNIPLQSALGGELFVTDLNVVLQRYIHSVARTYAVNAPLSAHERIIASRQVVDDMTGATKTVMPTDEPIVVQIINEGLDFSGGKYTKQRVAGTNVTKDVLVPGTFNAPMKSATESLVRALQGQKSEDEILWGNLFSSVREKLSANFGRIMGPKRLSQVDDAITTFEQSAGYNNIMNGISSHFYATTLGLNPWSTIQNLLQPGLTTVNAIGIGPTLAGYKVLSERIPQYARGIRRHMGMMRDKPHMTPVTRFNEAMETSFRETFPELSHQGMRIDPRLFSVNEKDLIDRGIIKNGRFSKVDDYYKLMLQPFTNAEMANQVVSFFGAKRAIRDAMRQGTYTVPGGIAPNVLEDYINFDAMQVVGATQFRPGPGSRSTFQNWLPAPFRQFTSFPVRLANFFADSTVRGALTGKQVESMSAMDKVLTLGTGRNVGTLARTYITATALTNGLRDVLGVDVSGALGILSPFNVPPSSQPFAPLPMPPAASMVYGLASYAATRDTKDLQPLVLPGVGEIPVPKQLLPGGIAVSRVARAMNAWRPDMGGFVDENERLMYRGNTTDFVLSMMGVPLDKQRRSREAVERMHDMRTRMRDYRRQFTQAVINGDTVRMDSLRAEYQDRFPDLPPLSVNESDVRRYQAAARMTQVQRMLKTLGAGARYLERDIYDVSPDLIALPAFGGGL